MAKKIFLSYRRYDTAGTTGRLHDYLVQAFGEKMIFKDVSDIPAGVDFRKVLGREILAADIILVMIGQHYTSVKNAAGELRLFDPNDFVRIEVETAINMNKIVIPVLVDGAQMPSTKNLPKPLHELVNFNAVTIAHDRWKSDVGELVRKIKFHFKGDPDMNRKAPPKEKVNRQASPPPVQTSKQKSWMLPATLGILGTLVLLIIIGLILPDDETSTPVNPVVNETSFVYVDTDELNVRNAPGTDNTDVIGVVHDGDKLKVLAEDFVKNVKWLQVESNQYRGWVSSRLVAKEPSGVVPDTRKQPIQDEEPEAPEPPVEEPQEIPMTYAEMLVGSWDCYRYGTMYNNGATLFMVTFNNGQMYSSANGLTYNYAVVNNIITVLGDNIYEIYQMDQNNVHCRFQDVYGNTYVASYRRRN